jgi:hypothetical protein
MKTKLVLLFFLVLLIGCGSDTGRIREITELRTVCDKSSIEPRASFIIGCLKNANPASDEDPEDWMRICQEMGERLYCDKREVYVKQIGRCYGGCFQDILESVK